MEVIEKNRSGRFGVLGVVLLAAGAAILCLALGSLPTKPAFGFPWEFAGALLALGIILAGGWSLGASMNQRKNGASKYGQDGSAEGVTFGMMVIVAGALLLAFNSGVLPMEWRRVFFSWQMLLLVGSMNELARGHITFGTILLTVGGFFMIRRLAPIYPDISASGVGDNWWPVLLIAAGVLILGGIFFKPRRGKWHEGCCGGGPKGFDGKQWDGKPPWGNKGSRTSGVIDITTVFGGSEQVYLDPEFRGGKISSVFGGVKLDLRRTALPEGETYLTVESVFGGIEIDAPEEWKIEIRNESVFGGFADKRLPPLDGYVEGRKLVVKASNIFGGGDIK